MSAPFDEGPPGLSSQLESEGAPGSPLGPPAAAAGEPALEAAEGPPLVAVELVLETHVVRGRIRFPGGARRLVDALNGVALSGYVVVHEGTIEDDEGAAALGFQTAHVMRDAVLFATAERLPPAPPNTFEAVQKVPVPATLLLPGYEVSGNIYMVPGVDPENVPLLNNHNFIPVSEAAIRRRNGNGGSRSAELVVVNLARALLYAPHTRAS